MQFRQITGVFATETYLREPRIPVAGARLRLRPDWADFERVWLGACPYLLNHQRGQVVGKVSTVWHDAGAGYRFVADLPVDDAEPIERVIQYLREYDQGIRGLFSPSYRLTRVEPVGRDADGAPLFDGGWMLAEISDETVPLDVRAKADAPETEQRALADPSEADLWARMGLTNEPDLDPSAAGLVSMRSVGQGWVSPKLLTDATSRREINIEEPLIRALGAGRMMA